MRRVQRHRPSARFSRSWLVFEAVSFLPARYHGCPDSARESAEPKAAGMSGPRCDECGDQGFFEVEIDGVTAMTRCGCVEKQIERRRLRRVNAVVPGIFRAVSLDSNPLVTLPK